MKAGICVSFCLIINLLVRSCTALTNITADVGENVTLTCKVPDKYKNFTGVEWNRHGLDPEYVLRWQYGHLDPHHQHRSYKNRVDLQDKEMKDGDFSLILKNVMKNDTGRYEGRVYEGENKLICSINLEVVEPGDQEGSIGHGGDMVAVIGGLVAGVIVLAVLAFIGFLFYKRRMKKNPNLPVPTEEAAPIPMPTRSESAAEPTPPSAPLMDPAEEEETEM